MLVQVVHELAHLLKGKTLRIQSEHPTAIHVVNVCPHGLQGNVSMAVVVDNLGNIINIAISVAAIMELPSESQPVNKKPRLIRQTYTKGPVGLHRRQTHNFRVLLSHILGCRASQEIEIQNTSNGVVLQVLASIISLINLDIHAVGVQEEDAVCTIVTTVVHVDRVITIQIRILWDTVGIAAPESARVVLVRQTQRISVLTQAVQVWVLWQPGPQSKVLVLKDQGGFRGIEEHLVITQDPEREGLSLIVEADVGLALVVVAIGVGASQDGSRDLVNVLIEIRDQNVKTIIFAVSV